MSQRLPPGAVVTAWLILALVAWIVWLFSTFQENEPPQGATADVCETITQTNHGTEQHNDKASDRKDKGAEENKNGTEDGRLAEYTCQLAVYTAQLATFTKWLVFVTVIVALVGIWQGYQLRTHAGHMERNIETLPRVERAYIFVSGEAFRGTVDFLGGGASRIHRFPGGQPNWFRFDINNYGKTPGELIEIRSGFIDGTPPETVPATSDIQFFGNWIKPEAPAGLGDYLIVIPQEMEEPIIFGRVYYRDVVLGQLHSSGFIFKITQIGAEPILVSRAYTEERDEPEGA